MIDRNIIKKKEELLKKFKDDKVKIKNGIINGQVKMGTITRSELIDYQIEQIENEIKDLKKNK